MRREDIQVLKKTELFQNINANDLESMLKCIGAKTFTYKKNEYVAFAGEGFRSIGIVLDGALVVVREDMDGNRLIINLVEPGEMIGEIVVFSKNPVWPASVQTKEDSRVCFIPSAKIISPCCNACVWHLTFIKNLIKAVSDSAVMLNRKVEFLTIKSMRGRLCKFLLEKYKELGKTTLTLSMNRNQLADYLNVSRPSMSREICRMRDEGIIEFNKNTFRIVDVAALERAVEL